jgi:hypothetical protein
MLWLFIVGFICSLYELLMGFIGIFFADVQTQQLDWFRLTCKPGIRHQGTVWDAPDPASEMFLTLHTVVIIMWSMIHYVVFFIIPFRFNRIMKTPAEVILYLLIIIIYR